MARRIGDAAAGAVGEKLVILFCVLQLVIAQDFGYEGNLGPTHWGEQYTTCTGKHQSPINIDSLSVQRVVLPPLVMKGFDFLPDKTNISNNGHTVMYTMDAEHTPTISGGPLDGVYEFAQLHFHWGENDTQGSEDMIDGISFPLELHMVFYKKIYRNSRAALDHPDGLCVLAFFYEVSDHPNANYEELVDLVTNITKPGNANEFTNPPLLSDLLPDDLVHYFTYAGSLTTPPCSEVVTWMDFKQPILLSHNQIMAFRDLEDAHGHHLTHNFRPIQDIGDRIVRFNIESLQDNTLEIVPLDPLTVYDTQKPTPKPTLTFDYANAKDDNDDDDDVGIGSVQQNIPPLGVDDDVMPSEFPKMGGEETASNELGDGEAKTHPKQNALKGKNGAPAARSWSRLCASMMVFVSVLVVF